MTTKTKAIIGGAVGGIVLLALLGGGPPSELEVKGLRLGMSVEEAARVMLGHGLPPGGSAEWDPAESQMFVSSEYHEAHEAHYRSLFEPKFQAAGVDSFAAYMEKTLTPEQFQRALKDVSGLYYVQPEAVDKLGLIERWERLGLPPFLGESDRFPAMEEYLAQKYPEGPPYEMGGPWTGEEPLKLSGNELRTRNWTLQADESGNVVQFRLASGAIAELFGAEDMGAEEFAASFASAYDVPLDPTAEVVDPDIAVFTGNFLKTGWAYVNRDAGWAVNISDAKVLEVRAITPASKQSFD
jgi:hypothetical protein